jgi:hypothetical protein
LAEYRCGLTFVRPETVYACSEFEAKVHLSCYLESGTGPRYVDLANAPTLWWLDNRFVRAVGTDELGWASVKLHVAEPGLHRVTVEFPGAFRDGNYYRPARVEHEFLAEPPPTQPAPPPTPPPTPPAPPITPPEQPPPPAIPPQPPLTLLLTYVGATMPLVFVGSVMVAQAVAGARPGKPV